MFKGGVQNFKLSAFFHQKLWQNCFPMDFMTFETYLRSESGPLQRKNIEKRQTEKIRQHWFHIFSKFNHLEWIIFSHQTLPKSLSI